MSEESNQRPGRPDDSGYNNPSRGPAQTRKLSAQESEAFDTREGYADQGVPADSSEANALTVVGALRRLRAFVRRSLLLLLLGVCILGLVVYAIALDFIIRVAEYPVYLQIPVWLLVALVVILVLYALIRISFAWLRLARHKQVDLSQADPGQMEQAHQDLSRYLNKLIAHSEVNGSRWQRLWCKNPEAADEVIKNCRKLVEERHIDTPAWLEEFESNVRIPLDKAAAKRVSHYSQLVGIKTAVSPFPLVDSAAVLYNNFLLIGDLAILFGRRIPRHEIVLLLWAIIFQTFVATQSQEILESVAEEMSKNIQSGITRSLAQFIAPRVAEGTVHAMVTLRIGRRAQRMLRPVVVN